MIATWMGRKVTDTFAGGVRLLTLGGNPDHRLLAAFANRKKPGLATVVDVRSRPSLDQWEDVLLGGPVAALLVRPGAVLPPTPLFHARPLAMPAALTRLGDWLKPLAPRYGWNFPPGWKFPDWIVGKLPRLSPRKRQYAFADLSASGLDNLLAEYAGVIDRGNAFRLTNPALADNIASYLRACYGGEHGLARQAARWADATEAMNPWDDLILPGHGRYQEVDRDADGRVTVRVLPPQGNLAPRFADFADPDTPLWDSVFMGSAAGPAANLRTQKHSFTVNGRSYRRYHEGSPPRAKYRPRVDDDPSDMITCGQVRSRSHLKYRSRTAPPEGTSFAQTPDWEPGPQDLETFLATLDARGVEYDLEVAESGYHRITDHFHTPGARTDQCPQDPGGELVPGKDGRDRPRRVKDRTTVMAFVPAREWGRHWDRDRGGGWQAGFASALPPAERKQWVRSKAGLWVTFVPAVPYARVWLFFPSGERPDAPLNPKSARGKALRARVDDPAAPVRLLQKVARVRKTKAGDEVWELPKTIHRRDTGEPIHLAVRPPMVAPLAWKLYLQCYSALETVRKLLAEERWEKLAFDPAAPVGLRFQNERDLFQDPAAEAMNRIRKYVGDLKARVRASALDPDVKQAFDDDVRAVRALVGPCVRGERAGDTVTLLTMNPARVADPAPRKMVPEGAEAIARESERALYAAYGRLARQNPDRAPVYRALQARILWRVGGKVGPRPAVPGRPFAPAAAVTRPKPTRAERHARVAWVQFIAGDEARPAGKRLAARRWLLRWEARQADGVLARYTGRGERKKVSA